MNAITIVGGGPAGLLTALDAAQEGWEVTAIEEHHEIGKPVNCAGLISETGIKDNGLEVEEVVLNRIFGARFVAPNNDSFEVKRHKSVAVVLDRAAFDKSLAKKAREKGVAIRASTKLLDIRKETLFVESEGRGELLKSQIVVGADGPKSKVREIMGLKAEQTDFVHSYQVRAHGYFDKRNVELHFGGFAKGFFAWVIPEDMKTARIGLACAVGSNPKQCFNDFVAKKGLKLDAISESSALIPCRKPLGKEICTERFALIGDAAFQTKATTGGGIIASAVAAKALGSAISEHLKNQKPLQNYFNNLSQLNKELSLHWRLRSFVNSMDDEKLNGFFAKVKKAGIDSFLSEHGDMDKPSSFIHKLAKMPKTWLMIPELIRFLR